MTRLAAIWLHLTAPHQALSAPVRRRAQFLASTLLFLLAANAIIMTVALVLATPALRPGLLLNAAVNTGLLLPLYLLSRTVHLRLASLLTGYALGALVLLVALYTAQQPLLLVMLIFPLLIASVMLSLPAAAMLVAATLLTLLASTFLVEARLAMLLVIAFYAVSAGLLLLIATHQRLLHTEQEAVVRESEMRFQTLAEKALVGVYIVQDGLFRYVNPAMAKLFGYAPDEIADRLAPQDLVAPDSRSLVADHIDERLHGESQEAHYTLVGLHKSGAHVECEVLGSTMTYNGRPAFIGTLLDLTNERRLQQTHREQRAFLEALQDSAAALNSTLDLEQVLNRILESVGRVVPHDGANIMLLDGDTAHFARCVGHYFELDEVSMLLETTYSLRDTYNLRQMVQTKRPIVISDTLLEAKWQPTAGAEWIRSYVGAPISRGDEIIGFLNLDSLQPGFFTEEHANRLMAFVDQVAIAMNNARLFQELESYSEFLEQAVASRTLALRRTTEQVEVILNNSPDAVLLLHNNGVVRMANPAFYEMFGYGDKEVLQQPLPSLVTPAGEARFLAALESVLKRGKRARLELVARRKDGATFDADIALAPVLDDGIVRGGVCSLHDISRLKEVDRIKDAFVSNVSHELRTPITSLRLYHDLLVRNPGKQEVYLQRQEREIERLNTIIEDLLRLSRLDRGQLDVTLQKVSLNEIIDQYILDRRPLAAELGLEIEWQPSQSPLTVRADRGLLEQVIGILLTNAFNYTAPGSCVQLYTVARRRHEHTWATCSILDAGPGLDAKELPHLFDRFFRGAAAQQSRTPGTGLGLAIAREIVERHDGFIEAYNRDDATGALFTLWLPLVDDGATPRRQDAPHTLS